MTTTAAPPSAHADNPPLDVTIVSPCRNEVKRVAGFVRCLLDQQLEGIAWEAIIADGGSDDGTREELERRTHGTRVRVIDNPERIVSTGLNQAIRKARGRAIVRMDMHTEYAPDYVARCLDLLRQTGANNVGGPARTKPSGMVGSAIAAAYHSPFGCGGARFHDPDYRGWVDTVTYGCWEKAYLEAIGLFDEALVRNQDDELNLRIVRSGGRIWQDPSIRSWYQPRNSLRSLFLQYFQYGFWKVAVIRKHRLPASLRHLIPGAFAAANLGFAITIGLSALAGASHQIKFLGSFWLLLWAAYLTLAAIASAQAARKHGWSLIPLLPAVFLTLHVAYGLGFLSGMAHARRFGGTAVAPASVFTGLSR